MQAENIHYEIVYPDPDNATVLALAAELINRYADQGLMLSVTIEQLTDIAARGLLALAVDASNQVVGTAAITFEYPDQTLEFGGWAIAQDNQARGVGKQLFYSLLRKIQGRQAIAFGNNNSAPIFNKCGATAMDQAKMHPDAFVMCGTCNCAGKEHLQGDNRCVDTIFDLSTIEV